MWIKISKANDGHHEMYENFADVLSELNIEVYRDEDVEEKEGCDLFIRIEDNTHLNKK